MIGHRRDEPPLPRDRPDAISLIQRLVDLVQRLFVERMELARVELAQGARGAARTAAWAFAGGLLLLAGLGLVAAAAVDALAPLVASRPLRCLVVALPLLAAGALAIARATRRPPTASP